MTQQDRLTVRQVQRERQALVKLYAKLGALAELWMATQNAGMMSRQRRLQVQYDDVMDAALELAMVFQYKDPESHMGDVDRNDPWILWERLLYSDRPNTTKEFEEGMQAMNALGRLLGVYETTA